MSDATCDPFGYDGVWRYLTGRYQTPSVEPATYTCRLIRFPDVPEFRMALTELLARLADCANWDSSGGGLSAQRAAALGSAILDSLAESGESCMIQPIGSVTPYAGQNLPDGWLWCDGTQYLVADYPELAAVLHSAFLNVNGTHFNVPDLTNRFVLGATFEPEPIDTAGAGGTPWQTLNETQLPAHDHGMTHNHGYFARDNATSFGATNRNAMAGAAGTSVTRYTFDSSESFTDTEGLGQPFSIMPPFLVLPHMIRAR